MPQTQIMSGLGVLKIFEFNTRTPFYRLENRGSKRLRNIHRITQLIKGDALFDPGRLVLRLPAVTSNVHPDLPRASLESQTRPRKDEDLSLEASK